MVMQSTIQSSSEVVDSRTAVDSYVNHKFTALTEATPNNDGTAVPMTN